MMEEPAVSEGCGGWAEYRARCQVRSEVLQTNGGKLLNHLAAAAGSALHQVCHIWR